MFTSQEKRNLKKLLSYAVNKDNVINLDGVHGFLYGLAIMPQTIVPSEWLPNIFGDEMLELETKEDGERLLGTLFSTYNRIIRENDEGKLCFPFDLDTIQNKDIQRMRDWAHGFFLATSLRPHIWGFDDDEHDDLYEVEDQNDDSEEDEITACHAVIMGVAFPDRIPELFPKDKKQSAKKRDSNLEATLFAMLPDAVATLQAHANAYRDNLQAKRADNYSVRPQPRKVEKIGRNDPCPCGSGVKYKKCCGK